MLAPDADIIVTGITLDDDIDGVEVVSRLRHDGGTMHKPIIVLTACAWRTDRARAEHAGCDAFLPSRVYQLTCCAKCGGCYANEVRQHIPQAAGARTRQQA